MKRASVVLLAVLVGVLLMPEPGHGQGTVEDITFYSPSIGADRQVRIYLPEGYENSHHRYPVVYHLHGYGYSHAFQWWYFNITQQLDALISSGAIEPIIFVGPSGYEDRYRGAYYSDSELYGDFESYIAHDVVHYVDRNYRTIPGRELRHIIGHSMGGYGAMRVALKHKERFGSVSSMAGVLNTVMYMDSLVEDAIAETPGPPYDFNPATGSIFGTVQLFACSGAWSPNLDNPPYYVDLPCDESGEIIQDVAARWAENDLALFAQDYARRLDDDGGEDPMDLWLGIGLADHGLRPYSDAFSESLDMLGLAHAFVEYEGDHFIVPLDVVLPHINDLIVAAREDFAGGDEDWGEWETPVALGGDLLASGLGAAQPNPFRGATRITYALTETLPVKLTVFDIAGRSVGQLVNSVQGAGHHEAVWEASELPAGIYFYRLETGRIDQTRRVVVVR